MGKSSSVYLVLLVLFFSLSIVFGYLYLKYEKKYEEIVAKSENIRRENDRYKEIISKSEYYTKMARVVWGERAGRCDAGLIIKIEKYINQIDTTLNVDMVLSLIVVESGFNQYIISSANAYGLMQLLFSTAKLHDSTLVKPEELFDEDRNIILGIKELSRLNKMFSGNKELVLAAYLYGYNGTLARIKNGNLEKWYQTKIIRIMKVTPS
ncbi:MAG: transglycosylase SLT domain-containing protein [Candidatus Aenigmatarchaeota archaeon]